MSWTSAINILTVLCVICDSAKALTPVVVKNVTTLGPQLTPDVTNVSRDGGYSALINGNIVWLFDDTECMDLEGTQLSFISNTAAYATQPNNKITTLTDFGVVNLDKNNDGSPKTAILADTTVGTGGWIPFQPDELNFNYLLQGKERVAIWPGTSPTSISTTEAFLFAPLIYVDSKPQDPSKEYQARGMTLIAIQAPSSGPVAARQGDLIIPGQEVPFGGFSALLGYQSTDALPNKGAPDRDVYLLGATNAGLQLARVGIKDITTFDKYTFWNPETQNFTMSPPRPMVNDPRHVYQPGTFSSGSVFYSPYFKTFVMIYFNKMVDSIFYIRYLMLNEPLSTDPTWPAGGKNASGIIAEDAEALVKYPWSVEQKLYASPPGKGGFNYAGVAHPEYFNRRYFAKSLYTGNTPAKSLFNAWYGSRLIAEKDAGGDGKNLLLSWTSQKVGGTDNGIYEIQLAMIEFDDIPAEADVGASPTATESSSAKSNASPTHSKKPPQPVSSAFAAIEDRGARGMVLSSRLGLAAILIGLNLAFRHFPHS